MLVVTDPDLPPQAGMSMFLVPTDTPGVKSCATSGSAASRTAAGSTVWCTTTTSGCRPTGLLGEEGRGFEVAQTRLGGGRVHHAMRTVGVCTACFDMMCERALSRTTKGALLADKQAVQIYIADS